MGRIVVRKQRWSFMKRNRKNVKGMIALVFVCAGICTASDTAKEEFPSGGSTPEGIACDLARAVYIKPNREALVAASIGHYGGPDINYKYDAAMVGLFEYIRLNQSAENSEGKSSGELEKLYRSRSLNKKGSASYGYAVYNFHDIKFVDVQIKLPNKGSIIYRVLVVKNQNGKWSAHPCPHVDPLLCEGLSEEKPSSVEFKRRENLSSSEKERGKGAVSMKKGSSERIEGKD